jgi:ankyrin repeat protein
MNRWVNFLSIVMLMTVVGCASAQDKKLIDAACRGNVDEIEKLIADGANVNAVALDDWTPLTCAADNGQVNAVQVLLSAGADINKRRGDLTPLCYAALRGHVATTKLLTEKGAKLSLPEAGRQYLLQRIRTNPEIVRLIADQLPKSEGR